MRFFPSFLAFSPVSSFSGTQGLNKNGGKGKNVDVIQSVIGFGVLFALLFGAAGTVAWPEAWLYILIQFGFSIFIGLWLKKHNPELLKIRSDILKRVTKSWDKAIWILILATFAPFLILPGLDAVRYQWSHVTQRSR